jgi:hypothetical protein
MVQTITLLLCGQKDRLLTSEKLEFLKVFKACSLGFAVIEKSKIRQRAQLTSIELGDANTKFFHLIAKLQSEEELYPMPTAHQEIW